MPSINNPYVVWGELGTKKINETDMADGKVLAYDSDSDSLVYVAQEGGSGGGSTTFPLAGMVSAPGGLVVVGGMATPPGGSATWSCTFYRVGAGTGTVTLWDVTEGEALDSLTTTSDVPETKTATVTVPGGHVLEIRVSHSGSTQEHVCIHGSSTLIYEG